MDVRIPDESVDEGVEAAISVWLFKTGEIVAKGDVLAEVMNEKAMTALESPAAGRLTILVAAEIAVRRGDVIARID